MLYRAVQHAVPDALCCAIVAVMCCVVMKMLWCAKLCQAVVRYATLYWYTVLCCPVLPCAVLRYIVVRCAARCCTLLCCTLIHKERPLGPRIKYSLPLHVRMIPHGCCCQLLLLCFDDIGAVESPCHCASIHTDSKQLVCQQQIVPAPASQQAKSSDSSSPVPAVRSCPDTSS